VGNFSCLYTLEQDVPRGRLNERLQSAVQFVSKYHVPLLWLALYSESDIKMCQEASQHDAEFVPHLVCDTKDGLGRLLARQHILIAAFTEHLRPLLLEFHDVVLDADQKFVHLETMDIGGMQATPDSWAEDLKSMLSAFDSPSPRNTGTFSSGWSCYFHYFPRPVAATASIQTAYFLGDDW
jgi:hypothetical protein